MTGASVLLHSAKVYLNIAYEDSMSDEALVDIITRGMSILDGYAGAEQDYTKEGLPRQLLFDYCRYARSHAAEMFSINFRRELISLREQAEVAAAQSAPEAEETEDEDTDAD